MAIPRTIDQIKPAEIARYVLRAPSANKHGGNQSWINASHSGIDPVVFQTPSPDSETCCTTPFGISPLYVKPGTAPDPNKSKDRLNCEVTINDPSLMAYLQALDEWVRNKTTVENYAAWFGAGKNPPTPEILRHLYHPSVTAPAYPKKDGKEDTSQPAYSRTFRCKFNMTPNGTKCFVSTRQADGSLTKPRPVSPIEAQEKYAKFAKVCVVVKVSCVYYQQGGASGVTFEALQALFVPTETVSEYSFNLGNMGVLSTGSLEQQPLVLASKPMAEALSRADERARDSDDDDDDMNSVGGGMNSVGGGVGVSDALSGFAFNGPAVDDDERA